jgi:hypothetical protein
MSKATIAECNNLQGKKAYCMFGREEGESLLCRRQRNKAMIQEILRNHDEDCMVSKMAWKFKSTCLRMHCSSI